MVKIKTKKITKKDLIDMPPIQYKIELVPGKVFEIKPGHKYFLILPNTPPPDSLLDAALSKFFGENQVMAIAVKDINEVKIAELLEKKKSSTGSP